MGILSSCDMVKPCDCLIDALFCDPAAVIPKDYGRDYSLDGTLLEGQRFTAVKKGKRVFERTVSMDICKRYVQLCKNDLIQFVKLNQYHDKLFFAEWYGRDYSVEITNIRAAQREGRDLR